MINAVEQRRVVGSDAMKKIIIRRENRRPLYLQLSCSRKYESLVKRLVKQFKRKLPHNADRMFNYIKKVYDHNIGTAGVGGKLLLNLKLHLTLQARISIRI